MVLDGDTVMHIAPPTAVLLPLERLLRPKFQPLVLLHRMFLALLTNLQFHSRSVLPIICFGEKVLRPKLSPQELEVVTADLKKMAGTTYCLSS